ncbi:MAG TPA: hypothetical protein VGC13_22830 [Longimicrobium sp.]|uniref:hypothetical protein n=1 Tax=Longimicrobium sp. TaxID=2029185 RepID=UPI002ED9256F
MSAPALHPAARLRPVLLERLERQRGAHCVGALVLASLAVWLRVDSVQVTYSEAVFGVLLLGVYLPGMQEIGPGGRVWDATLPVNQALYARVRLVCGVAWAAFLLAVVVGLYAALFGDPGHPAWYPLALLAWGLTSHLLTSAVLLRSRYPAVGALCVVAVLVAGVSLLLAWIFEEPAELGRMGVTAVLTRTALPLGLAGAAAFAVARYPASALGPAGPAAQRARAPRRDLAPALPIRPASPPVWRGGPARPSATLTILWRHLGLMRRFTIVPALTLLVMIPFTVTEPILDLNEGGEGPTVRSFVESTGLGEWCAFIALSWTVLVWLAERNHRRRWNDTLPVDAAKRRVLHATAGALWLLLFVTVGVAVCLGKAAAAGMLDAPADAPAWLWLGLSIRTLTLYLAATAVFFCTCVAHRALPLLGPCLFLNYGMNIVESQVPVGFANAGPAGWSHAVSALWLVLYAAAAAGAVTLEDWAHRCSRIPTLREMRGFLHGWAGTRPGPSLHGHAGR